MDIISRPKLPIEFLNMFVSFLPCIIDCDFSSMFLLTVEFLKNNLTGILLFVGFIFIKVASFLNAMHAIKGGWVGQTFALAKNNESEGRKSRIRRSKEERKEMVVAFIKK